MQPVFVGFCFKRHGDVVELQPFQTTDENVPTLIIDLENGGLELRSIPRFTRNYTILPGAMGVLKLTKTAVLITIDESKQVKHFIVVL